MNSYIQNSIIANLTNGKLAESIANALGDKKLGLLLYLLVYER